MLFALASSTLTTASLASTLTTQLQDLVSESATVNTQLLNTSLTSTNTCTELGTASTSLGDLLASIEIVSAGLTAPLTLTDDDLTSLDDLSHLAVSMANSVRNMSLEINNIADVAELFEYQASLAAMLRLADDIGTMADRILEMSNDILIMADNIGTMADRIITTQTLQNTNIALTQASMLTTQQNIIALSGTLDTFGFNAALSDFINDNTLLTNTLQSITLTESNMATELAAIAVSATASLNQVNGLYEQIILSSESLSYQIDGDTLTLLGDLSAINATLAQALDSYAQAISSLAPLTTTPVLSDATASMLSLTRDIGEMANRIMEMVDNIIIMADNIGIMASRIVETENLQQTNITLTQDSLTTATTATVDVIATYSL